MLVLPIASVAEPEVTPAREETAVPLAKRRKRRLGRLGHRLAIPGQEVPGESATPAPAASAAKTVKVAAREVLASMEVPASAAREGATRV